MFVSTCGGHGIINIEREKNEKCENAWGLYFRKCLAGKCGSWSVILLEMFKSGHTLTKSESGKEYPFGMLHQRMLIYCV